MKKLLSLILVILLALTAAACSAQDKENDDSGDEEPAADKALTAEQTASLDDTLDSVRFEGVVRITKNGEEVYRSESGMNENGEPLTTITTMYLGSVSKQFCAACIMILRDSGKLSVDDTLDKYYPEYKYAKDISIKNLLTMRSGIRDMVNEGTVTGLSPDKTDAENTAVIKKWIFDQPLGFDPDTEYAYSNSNYFLLGNIVEQVSGQTYIDFVRENIFEPLEMTRSGSVDEIADAPDWARGLTADTEMNPPGLTKGAGDILSNALDMDKWMAGLSGGKLFSVDTYHEMTDNYSPEAGTAYGYGLYELYHGGKGHGGLIMANSRTCSAVDYINEENGYHLFAASNDNYMSIDSLPADLLEELF